MKSLWWAKALVPMCLVACTGFKLPETNAPQGVKIVKRTEGREVVFEVKANPDRAMPEPLKNIIRPIETEDGDWLVLPSQEGLIYPVGINIPSRCSVYRTYTTGYDGFTLAFFGVVRGGRDGSGYMVIMETPDDAGFSMERINGRWTLAPWFDSQQGKFGYDRRVRYVPIQKGGYVAMAKRYRQYAKERGLLKTYAEKAEYRPKVKGLVGAANIWWWDRSVNYAQMAEELQNAGIRRFIWSAGRGAAETKRIAAMKGVLVGRYDIYQDLYRPEVIEKMRAKSRGGKDPSQWKGPNHEAWPDDAAWSGTTPDTWVRGWGCPAEGGGRIACGVMCDLKAPKYFRKNVDKDLETLTYTSRFIDTTTAVPLRECRNPAHPMTRTQSREARLELLKVCSCEYRFVTGSEVGADWSVPYCDYFEGMMSPCAFRIPNAGTDVEDECHEYPPAVKEWGLNPKYRIPLFDLVFRDCASSFWFWGDYNNKMPDLWDIRDRFNVLYGQMPMFIIDKPRWEKYRDRFIKSYQDCLNVAREAGYAEMTNHEILSDDRMIQRTTFANGASVTVDFATGRTDIVPAKR